MIRTTLVALSVCFALLSSPAGAQVPQNNEPDNREIVKLAAQWTEAYNTNDSARLAALYSADAHLYNHGRARLVGRNAIRDFWAKDFTEGNPLTVLTVTDSIDGVDMRLVHGNYQVLNRKTGVQLGHGRFAHIWLKQANGQWQLDRDVWLERE
jgi:uncharacterized protein (TIGR02246 family)